MMNRLFRHLAKKSSKLYSTNPLPGEATWQVANSHRRPLTHKQLVTLLCIQLCGYWFPGAKAPDHQYLARYVKLYVFYKRPMVVFIHGHQGMMQNIYVKKTNAMKLLIIISVYESLKQEYFPTITWDIIVTDIQCNTTTLMKKHSIRFKNLNSE